MACSGVPLGGVNMTPRKDSADPVTLASRPILIFLPT